MTTTRNMFAEDTDSNGVVSLKAARRTLGNLGGATDEELRDAQWAFANAFGECVAERVKRRAPGEPEAWTQEEIDASKARAKQTAAELQWAAEPEAKGFVAEMRGLRDELTAAGVTVDAAKLTAEDAACSTCNGKGFVLKAHGGGYECPDCAVRP